VFYLQQLAVAVHSHMKRVAYEAERRRRKAPSAPPPQAPGPASRQQQQQHQQQSGPTLSVKEPQEVPVCLFARFLQGGAACDLSLMVFAAL